MAERPDEYELDDYPERYQETDYPTDQKELKNFNENSLDRESYKNFRIRQQLIKSNRVGVHTSFLDGRQAAVKILKRNILSDILDIPFEEVDETKFDLKIEPIDIESYRLYYKDKPLVEYNAKYDRLNVISVNDVSLFKTKYINEIIDRYVKKEMKTDFSVRSDLSSLDLEVRQSESEEYHRELDRLQTIINKLKSEKRFLEEQANKKIRSLQDQLKRARQQQNISGGYDYKDGIIRNLEQELNSVKIQNFEISSIQGRRIRNLLDELEKTRIDTSNQVETLNESLKIKSIEIIESQNEVERLRENIKELEDEIRSGGENNDELNKNREEYNKELDRLEKQRDFYKKEKESLERRLRENIDTEQENIKALIEEKNKAQKERDESISIKDFLKNKIAVLNDSLEKYTTMHDVLKTISDNDKL